MEVINKHGIKVREYRTSHWGHWDKENKWHNATFHISECCWNCRNLDSGETGDYGDILSPPSCNLNVWSPTRSNKCGKKKAYKSYGEQ